MVDKSKDAVLLGKAGVYVSEGFLTEPTDIGKSKPVSMKDVENQESGGNDWAKWGEDDNDPVLLQEKLGKLSIGKRAICLNADSHFGAGVEFFLRKMENNKIVKSPVVIEDWENFKRGTNFDCVLSDTVEALETYYWLPVKFVTNVSKKEIRIVEALDPFFCRIGKRNKKGRVEKVYFSYKFPESTNKEDIVEYDVYDPQNPNKFSEFVIILKYSTSGRVYYPEPDYYSVFRNGWVDVACSVPQFIKSMYDKSVTIKYHIKIPLHHFSNKYKGWNEKTEKERLKIFQDEQTAMDDFLTGAKNAHKSFVSIFGVDDMGKPTPGWEITPIQDYMKKDAELPNNAAANSEILFAFGTDPSTIGLGIPGGKNLSGSGSDKREGVKIKQAFLFRERLVSMQLIHFIIEFNSIDTKGAVPRFIDVDTSQTLDENPTGKQTVVNG